jgi:hypothetical protein
MRNFYQTLLVLFLLASSQTFAQVPAYNSLPGATAVLFLDFDGHTVNGTSWNSSGPIVCGPSNLDNAKITEVFNRIAEDFRPFNINVTTDSTKYLAAPAIKRMRAIFTISNSWYGNSAGGVAYIGSFTWGDNTPCFIFTALFNYDKKKIAEAGAHELGHTLGLRHQATYDANCAKVQEYNSGKGSGETSWAPIMGIGYYRNVTSWHNGADPYGCTSTQNDIGIISGTNNGFGLRVDDAKETFSAATAQAFTNDQFNISGMITAQDDKDMFKFTLSSDKRLQLKATTTNAGTGDPGANLDIQIDLYNSQKKIIGTYNPANVLNVSIDTMLNSGTYYFLVDGVGNEFTSDYGSLGSYNISAIQSFPIALPLHKLELKGISENNKHKLDWIIDADEVILHQSLEVSNDGRKFNQLAVADVSQRTYNYLPSTEGALQYRLKVSFDNGREHYSNVIAIRNTLAGKPQLFSTVIRSNAIMLNSPSNYNFIVTDFSGRILKKGLVTKGASTVNIDNIKNGTYIIQFTNGQEQYVEKFVKQ